MENKEKNEEMNLHYPSRETLESDEEFMEKYMNLGDFEYAVEMGLQAAWVLQKLAEADIKIMDSAGKDLSSDPNLQATVNWFDKLNRLVETLKAAHERGYLIRHNYMVYTAPNGELGPIEGNNLISPLATLKRHEELKELDDFNFLLEVGSIGIGETLARAEQDLKEEQDMNKGNNVGDYPEDLVILNWVKAMRRVKDILNEAREKGACGFAFPSEGTPSI